MIRLILPALIVILTFATPAAAQRVALIYVPVELSGQSVRLPLRLTLLPPDIGALNGDPRRMVADLSVAPLTAILDQIAATHGGRTLTPTGSSLTAEGGALVARIRFRYLIEATEVAYGSVVARLTPAVQGSTITAIPGRVQLELGDDVLALGGDANAMRTHIEAILLAEIQAALSSLDVSRALPVWMPQVPVAFDSVTVAASLGGPVVRVEGTIGTRSEPIAALSP